MLKIRYLICKNYDCNSFTVAPKEFREIKHYGQCILCDSSMFMVTGNPEEAGYKRQETCKLIDLGCSEVC